MIDLELPFVRDYPACDEVVVVGVEGHVGVAEAVERFVGEGVNERFALEDRGPAQW